MTDTRVDQLRPQLLVDEVRIGRPVRSTTMTDLARLVHWVRGRGRSLVPQHVVHRIFNSGSVSFRYRTHPLGPAIERLWLVDVRQDPATIASTPYCSFTVQAGSGPTSATIRRAGRAAESTTVIYRETPTTKTDALTDLVLTIARVSGTVLVETVGCWEVPRGALTDDATDLGIHLNSFFARRQIYDGAHEGSRSIVNALAGHPGRRVGHVSWFGPEVASPSTSYVDVFELPIPVVPRLDRPGDTTLSLAWDVYARVSSAGTAGDFRIVIGSGGTSATLAVPTSSTANAWRGTGTVVLKAEDLATANGLRGGSADTVQLQMRRTAGTGDIAVSGFCVWEPKV